MKGNRFYKLILIYAVLATLLGTGAVAAKENGKIVHDAGYYILEVQNGEKWAAEDKELDEKLSELRKKYGRPPNIIHIMGDDTAYGDVGIPAACRGEVHFIFIVLGIQPETVHHYDSVIQ